MARVSGCELKNMTSSIFFTQKAFIRTVRVELRNCSLAGLAWLNGIRPKRLLQKGVTMERAKLDWKRAMRNTSSEGRERRSVAENLLQNNSAKKKTKKPSEAEEQKQMQQVCVRDIPPSFCDRCLLSDPCGGQGVDAEGGGGGAAEPALQLEGS